MAQLALASLQWPTVICPCCLFQLLRTDMLGGSFRERTYLVYLLTQKKAFDGATFNAAGGAYAMQGNIAAGYNFPYQEPGPATVAIAETMKQVNTSESLTSAVTCA